jgi:hypothetical protein
MTPHRQRCQKLAVNDYSFMCDALYLQQWGLGNPLGVLPTIATPYWSSRKKKTAAVVKIRGGRFLDLFRPRCRTLQILNRPLAFSADMVIIINYERK